MTVAQELVKEPCKSNPRGLKCTKKLRRVLQSEMKDIPAIKRRAAINKRLKEIKSSSTTVVRGKARRKLKKSYRGNLQQPGQVRGAVAPAANPAAPPISQPFGQLRPDFERANTDRLNAAANAGDRVQSAYYAQQLGLTPSIRNNALNQAVITQFGQPAVTNFQAQPTIAGAGVPQPAPTIASINAANQARLLQQQPLPQAAPAPAPAAAAAAPLYPGEPDESKSPDPKPPPPVIPISGPPRGSVNFNPTGSGPVNTGANGIFTDPSNVPGLPVEQPVISYPRNPRPESKGDVENRRKAAEMAGGAAVGRGERKKTPTKRFSTPPPTPTTKTPKTRKQVKIKPEAVSLLPPGPQPKKESIGKKLKTFLGKHLSAGGSKVTPGKPLSRAQARRNAQQIRRQAFPVTKK